MLDAVSYIVLATIRLGTPIAITAVGATISERTGVVNIGLEGIMGMGAFLAVLGSYWTGNPWFGVLLAVLVGVVISAIHGWPPAFARWGCRPSSTKRGCPPP